MVTEQKVVEILRTIKHPELGNDIVSLEMVKNLSTEAGKVSFTLELLKPNDPFATSIKKAAVKALHGVFGETVSVEILLLSPVAKPKESPYKAKASVSSVKNIIAVASGKGGVGKSTIAVNLAVAVARTGAKVGLIDADIFGPSIPKMLGMEQAQPKMIKEGELDLIEPVENYGVKHLSIGFFVNPNEALVWRGPMATNALRQLIHQGAWGELDYLFIDMPPGTSDIHLTLVQEVSVTGAVIVSTPQEIALADAIKGISMFTGKGVDVPVLGLIENMAWFTPEELPNNKYYLFGKEGCKKLAERMHLPLLGQIPIVQSIREGGDDGTPMASKQGTITDAFSELASNLIQQVNKRNIEKPATKKVEIKHK
ncbi:MAG TPA: Mrp/NBP35 family ATP-binding protein [Tenuifilaceae bacterium]|nr:Mrp/NBP35 family ATP-binding protein [Tenuifilaceae bacterium]HPE17570.1 Mrp/NBP35 family ATP-binding protein [Tenuifilaceae bacterium]HPJ45968.1 Mrp/NBP35 family ATP-binding protein [Tenuifilaceae bacterium]HPQ34312.1 Mrp/NBP35 family ATP-binding protein [Tenuifilaceae bacterium]HRX67980.1 Mrp/NBP35 family ATP-binding protein [Tenuifilaceae bacterium]